MKRSVSAILILLLAVQAFYPLALYSYYYANQSYIASVLCENKDRPQLQCKGKCALKKQLKKAEEQEQKNRKATEKDEVVVYLPASTDAAASPAAFASARDYNSITRDHYCFNYHPACFKPPRA